VSFVFVWATFCSNCSNMLHSQFILDVCLWVLFLPFVLLKQKWGVVLFLDISLFCPQWPKREFLSLF
jgi:hypothetical protein